MVNWIRETWNYKDGQLFWAVRQRGTKGVGTAAGYRRKDGYVEVGYRNKRYLLHRLIYGWHHGENLPDVIDHRDRDHTNNRIENLRASSKSENGLNSNKAKGRLALRGVHFAENIRKFQATIHPQGKTEIIGYFDTPEEAHAAYLRRREELFPGLVQST